MSPGMINHPIMQAGGLKGQVLSSRCPTQRPKPQLPSPSFLHFWSFLESPREGRKGTKGQATGGQPPPSTPRAPENHTALAINHV